MSVEFSNAYQEILLDNLMSIIKQNFVFQTQLKLFENVGNQKTELEIKYNELVAAMNSMQNRLIEAEKVSSIVKSNNSAHEEKQRIQVALNNEMKKNVGLNKQIEDKEAKIGELMEYIAKLEEIAPTSKLKKINPKKIVEVPMVMENPASNTLFTIKGNDGSSF